MPKSAIFAMNARVMRMLGLLMSPCE